MGSEMEKTNLVEKKTQIIKKRLLVLDTRKPGLNAIWKSWEAATLEALMDSDELTSFEAFSAVKGRGIVISRASVIQFLNKLVDAGFCTVREEGARGGMRKVYKLVTARAWSSINRLVVDRLLFALWEIFPDNDRIKLAIA